MRKLKVVLSAALTSLSVTPGEEITFPNLPAETTFGYVAYNEKFNI